MLGADSPAWMLPDRTRPRRGTRSAVWIAVYVTGRKSEAARIRSLLSAEGFLVEVRGEGPYEVVVPKGEAVEAQEVLQRL